MARSYRETAPLLPIVKSFMGEAGMVTVMPSNRDVMLGKL